LSEIFSKWWIEYRGFDDRNSGQALDAWDAGVKTERERIIALLTEEGFEIPGAIVTEEDTVEAVIMRDVK
jgi:hypothetical protein